MPANAALAAKRPMSVNETVRSRRPREYLTEREIERLIEAASGNRWGHRNATAILIAYRHDLRASELVELRWDDVDFRTGKLHVRRAKGGTASVHPLGGARNCGRCVGSSVRRRKAGGPCTSSSPSVEHHSLRPAINAWWLAPGSRWVPVPHPQPHAAPLVRLQTGQRRPGHQGDPALPRPSCDRLNGTLHGARTGSLQELLARLKTHQLPSVRNYQT